MTLTKKADILNWKSACHNRHSMTAELSLVWPLLISCFKTLSEVNGRTGFLAERFHLFPAFGAKDGGHVVFIHDRFTRQINEKKTIFVLVAGIPVTVKAMIAGTFLRIGWQWFHGLAAPGAEDGGQIVAVHHRFLGQFENEGPFVRMSADFTVAVEFRRHDQYSLSGS
ncbi:MAG: hypothetical protein KQI81_00210 [Deltaproteobacteria bacterium]|nr:hypothetical protein [Deltaproteobacteria bacterium]